MLNIGPARPYHATEISNKKVVNSYLFGKSIKVGDYSDYSDYSTLGLIFTVRTTKNVKPEIMFMFHIWLPSNLN